MHYISREIAFKWAGNLQLTISQIADSNRVLMAFSKVLNIVGEPSRNMIIGYIQEKYGISIYSNSLHSIAVEEIEDTILEIFPIGSELIVRMLEAELERMNRQQ